MHWIKDRTPQQRKMYQFTRLVSGLTLFVLDATVQYHLQNYITTHEKLVKQIMEDLYVDDLSTGREKMTDVQNTAIQIFKEAGFVLHKCQSNFSELAKK